MQARAARKCNRFALDNLGMLCVVNNLRSTDLSFWVWFGRLTKNLFYPAPYLRFDSQPFWKDNKSWSNHVLLQRCTFDADRCWHPAISLRGLSHFLPPKLGGVHVGYIVCRRIQSHLSSIHPWQCYWWYRCHQNLLPSVGQKWFEHKNGLMLATAQTES